MTLLDDSNDLKRPKPKAEGEMDMPICVDHPPPAPAEYQAFEAQLEEHEREERAHLDRVKSAGSSVEVYYPAVLVVEGDRESREGIQEIIHSLNGGQVWEAIGVQTLHQADVVLKTREIRQIDVIVLDLFLQDSGWSQALGWAMKSRVPFVVLSGDTDADVLRSISRAGAVSYLKKPVNPSELRLNVLQAFMSSMEERERAACERLPHGN